MNAPIRQRDTAASRADRPCGPGIARPAAAAGAALRRRRRRQTARPVRVTSWRTCRKAAAVFAAGGARRLASCWSSTRSSATAPLLALRAARRRRHRRLVWRAAVLSGPAARRCARRCRWSAGERRDLAAGPSVTARQVVWLQSDDAASCAIAATGETRSLGRAVALGAGRSGQRRSHAERRGASRSTTASLPGGPCA